MKAGTAQKMVLNMISTAAMIRLGYVRGNRMTNMRARNSKLLARADPYPRPRRASTRPPRSAALEAGGGDVATAVVMIRTGRPRGAASEALQQASGVIERAIASLSA